MKKGFLFLLFIIILTLYHFLILNGLEKMINDFFFSFFSINRPSKSCKHSFAHSLHCVGLPSGHVEAVTILSFLLLEHGYFSFPITLACIFFTGLQRVITSSHTLFQVSMGFICGFLYFLFYREIKWFPTTFLYALLFTCIYIFILYRGYEKELQNPLPSWVDPSMFESIQKKKNTPFSMKMISLFANAFVQEITYISWDDLKKALDILIDKLKNTGIQYDAVIGIKTGGAIISNYISKKLHLPNYKIKLSERQHQCNKKPSDSLLNTIEKQFRVSKEFVICEGIEDSLEGKNVILIDELVSSGNTMNEAFHYLQFTKKANHITPCSLCLREKNYIFDLQIEHILSHGILVFPWGYDN